MPKLGRQSQVECRGVTDFELVGGSVAAQAGLSWVTSSWVGSLRGFSRRRARRASRSEDPRGRAAGEGGRSGSKAGRPRLLGGRFGLGGRVDERPRLEREGAALDEALVTLLRQPGAREAGDGPAGFGGEVAARDEPLVILLRQQGAGEADDGLVVGEDADDVGAAADFLVDAFQRVGGAQLGPVLARQLIEGDQVLLGGLE